MKIKTSFDPITAEVLTARYQRLSQIDPKEYGVLAGIDFSAATVKLSVHDAELIDAELVWRLADLDPPGVVLAGEKAERYVAYYDDLVRMRKARHGVKE